jgi:hypothetical protein
VTGGISGGQANSPVCVAPIAALLPSTLMCHGSLQRRLVNLRAATGNCRVAITRHGNAPPRPRRANERATVTYTHPDLNLTNPSAGYTHFILYTELDKNAVTALNATVSFEEQTPLVREWFGRLQRSEPNALHAMLVGHRDIPKLFYPCVYEDKDSPAAVAGDGCTCYQTYYDPEFRLPVVADHYRTVTGNIETWTYRTIAPLDLRPGDHFGLLIIDRRGAGNADFWIRTTGGVLALIPEQEGRGYAIGYGGGGPLELARYIQQLIASDGRDTAAIGGDADVDDRVSSWACSETNTQSHELTLADLRSILSR